jgi:transposase-like protein
MAYKDEEKNEAIKLYYEGNTARAVGRVFGFSKANVLRWIREKSAKLPESDPCTAENTSEAVESIELDEMFHFTKKKN